MKRRVKQPHKDRTEEKEKSEIVKNAVREELDFQFDEELDSPPPTGRHNAFSEWLVDIKNFIRMTPKFECVFFFYYNIERRR